VSSLPLAVLDVFKIFYSVLMHIAWTIRWSGLIFVLIGLNSELNHLRLGLKHHTHI